MLNFTTGTSNVRDNGRHSEAVLAHALGSCGWRTGAAPTYFQMVNAKAE